MPTVRLASAKGAELTPTEADADMKRTAVSKTADYTLDATHNREFHQLGGTVATVTLPTVSASFTETDDWFIDLRNNLTTPITISRNSQNINGAAADVILHSGSTIRVRMDAATAAFYTDIVERNSGYTTKTASFSVASEHHNQVIGVSTSGGAVTATLPTVASVGAGFSVSFFITNSTNALTIDGNGAETINGATTITLNRINDSVTLMCDGSAWKIVKDARSLRGVHMYRTSAQGLADVTATAVPFAAANSSEEYDTDSAHSDASNTSRITVPSGVYAAQFFAGSQFAANATGVRRVEIYQNGSPLATHPARIQVDASSSGTTDIQVNTPIIKVSPTDYFEVFIYQNRGGSLDVTSWFSAKWY